MPHFLPQCYSHYVSENFHLGSNNKSDPALLDPGLSDNQQVMPLSSLQLSKGELHKVCPL